MVLTFPMILDDYYDEIEQNRFTIKNEEILSDCDYIIGELAIGEWYRDYSKNEYTDYRTFREIVYGSKQYEFYGSVLTLTGYYTGKRIRLDLSKVTPDVLREILADDEDNEDECGEYYV